MINVTRHMQRDKDCLEPYDEHLTERIMAGADSLQHGAEALCALLFPSLPGTHTPSAFTLKNVYVCVCRLLLVTRLRGRQLFDRRKINIPSKFYWDFPLCGGVTMTFLSRKC